jgi:hypothetical protein
MYFGNAESKLPEILSIFYGGRDSAPLIFKVVIFEDKIIISKSNTTAS